MPKFEQVKTILSHYGFDIFEYTDSALHCKKSLTLKGDSDYWTDLLSIIHCQSGKYAVSYSLGQSWLEYSNPRSFSTGTEFDLLSLRDAEKYIKRLVGIRSCDVKI